MNRCFVYQGLPRLVWVPEEISKGAPEVILRPGTVAEEVLHGAFFDLVISMNVEMRRHAQDFGPNWKLLEIKK